jgi:hypothetical protein
MLHKSYTSIRDISKNKLLGFHDVKSNKNYVIAFDKFNSAQRLCNWIPCNPIIILKRNLQDNITRDFNDALEEVGLGKYAVDALTIDYAANLIIPKRSKGDIDDNIGSGDYILHNIPASDMLLYPFKKSFGIVLPFQYVHETAKEFCYLAMVIDPSFNANLFMQGLLFNKEVDG